MTKAIMLETDVDFKSEFDGSDWHVALGDEPPGGPGLDSETAGKILRWLSGGGLQYIMDCNCKFIEKAFRERERANGNQ